ncbi:MAG: ferrochelatase, partial [Acidobacteriota bacterium]|nr:ferrochelatase [Acidobacteriota bacterium]
MSTGVLVMAYGTPSSREDVLDYYTRIRHGHPPSEEQLADLVRRYEAIGGISPLAARTDAQVRALAAALEERDPGRFAVRFGSKYEPPLIEEAAGALRDEGFTEVVGLALAPHSSSMSTDQYMARARDALGEGVAFHPVGAWWDAPGFLELIAGRVRAALDALPEDVAVDAEVLFSAHSLPERILASGDTYPNQLAESARRAAALAGVTRFDVAWQSAGRTADAWLGPDILEVLRAKAAAGVRTVVSCPIGFISDHLEVLFDIDVDAPRVAREVGLTLVRTGSLNDDP